MHVVASDCDTSLMPFATLILQIRCIVLRTPKEVCFSLAALRLADPSTPQEDRREISKVRPWTLNPTFAYIPPLLQHIV